MEDSNNQGIPQFRPKDEQSRRYKEQGVYKKGIVHSRKLKIVTNQHKKVLSNSIVGSRHNDSRPKSWTAIILLLNRYRGRLYLFE